VSLNAPANTVSVETVDGIRVLRVHPGLARLGWGEMEQVGRELTNSLRSRRRPCCVVDLSQLEMIGSAQLALLVQVWKHLRGLGGECVFSAPRPEVQQVISLAGLDRHWVIVSSQQSGLQHFEHVRASSLGSVLGLAAAGLGCAVGVAGLVLRLQKIGEPLVHEGLLFGGAAVALLAGGLVGWFDVAPRRNWGALAALVGVGLAIAGCWPELQRFLWFKRPPPPPRAARWMPIAPDALTKPVGSITRLGSTTPVRSALPVTSISPSIRPSTLFCPPVSACDTDFDPSQSWPRSRA